jgi:hypothetical protein
MSMVQDSSPEDDMPGSPGLFEFLAIVIIIGVLAATFAIPFYIGAQDRSREWQVKANAIVVKIVVEDWLLHHPGSPPPTLDELNDSSWWQQTRIKMPVNPWTEAKIRFTALSFSRGDIGFWAESRRDSTTSIAACAYAINYTIKGFGKAEEIIGFRGGAFSSCAWKMSR